MPKVCPPWYVISTETQNSFLFLVLHVFVEQDCLSTIYCSELQHLFWGFGVCFLFQENQ